MIEQFVKDATICVDTVIQVVDKCQTRELADAAHGLKGICANLGVKRMQAMAIYAEQLTKEESMNEGKYNLANLEAEFIHTQEVLKTYKL